MRKEADIQKWKELYELAFEIKQRKPWQQLADMDLIAVKLADREEPVYCSIMGSGGEYFAVACYMGQAGLDDFYRLVMADRDPTPVEYVMLSQRNLTCTFGEREDVSPEQKAIIKQLGYSFRGAGNWIYFESFDPGYVPYIPDQQEVGLLLEVYPQMIQALDAYLAEEIKVDFAAGMCLMRRFDEQTGIYVNEVVALPEKSVRDSTYTLSNEVQKHQLKKLKQNQDMIIMDLFYLNAAIEEPEYDKPVMPLVLMVVDWQTEFIIAAEMFGPEDDIAASILEKLCEIMPAMGRPQAVIIRNPLILEAVEKTCAELGIDVGYAEEAMELMDHLIEEMRDL